MEQASMATFRKFSQDWFFFLNYTIPDQVDKVIF
jgi:hypothetical protein